MKRLLAAVALFALAAAPALADPKSDLMATMVQFSKATSYHMTASGHGQTMVLDMQQPGKMHMVSPQFEIIKIDTATWVKMNGKWQKFALPGMDQMTAAVTAAIGVTHATPDQLTVTDLGLRAPNSGGSPMHAYSVVNAAGKSPSTIFVDGSGRIAEIDNTDGSNVRFTRFNDPTIDIEPPM